MVINGNTDMKNSVNYYQRIGNTAHVISLLMTLMFALSVVLYHSYFDASWQEYGFCVAHMEQPYWNSHDVCFYLDTVFSILLGVLLYWPYRNEATLQHANPIFKLNLVGILGHGMGHGGLAKALREDETAMSSTQNHSGWEQLASLELQTPWEYAQRFGPLTFFWMALLKASMPNMNILTFILPMALVVMYAQLFLPAMYVFTYVQTILMMAFSINQLARSQSEKDFHYAMYPILVGIPLTLVGWIESTQCSNFVKDYFYGHVIYDAYIPISILVWYLLCIRHYTTTTDTSKNHRKVE